MTPTLLRLIVHELCVFPAMADLMRRAVLTVPELPYVREVYSPSAAPPSDLRAESAFDEPGSPMRGAGAEAIQVACDPCRRSMLSAGLFLRRYSLVQLPPPAGMCDATPGYLPQPQLAYSGEESGTQVLFALDTWAEDGSEDQYVALKAMRRPDKLLREVHRRRGCAAQYVVPILRSYGLEDDTFSMSEDFDEGGDALRAQNDCCTAADVAEETQLRGLPRFIAVLPRLDGTLDAALAARRAQLMHAPQPRDWAAKRHLGNCLATALQHFHSRGLVYGDLRPSNVAYSCGAWLLLDLDGVCHVGAYLNDRIAPSYAPPEAVYLPRDGEPCLRTVTQRGLLEAWAPASLRAHPSLDIWALGAVLFEAIAGEKLFAPLADGSLSSASLRALADWNDAALEARLLPLMAEPLDNVAPTPGGVSPAESRDQVVALMRWLLQPSPSARPASMESVLKHRFLDPACGLDRDALVRGEASSSLVSALLARVGTKRAGSPLGGEEGVMGALVPGALGERLWRGLSAALMSYGSRDMGPAARGEDDVEAAYKEENDEPML
jgi:serine/threonine protein kinase